MSVKEIRNRLHAIRMALTRHINAAREAGDTVGMKTLIASRKLVTARFEELLAAELTASLAEIDECIKQLDDSKKALVALEAKSDQIAKVISIVDTALAAASKLAVKLVG